MQSTQLLKEIVEVLSWMKNYECVVNVPVVYKRCTTFIEKSPLTETDEDISKYRPKGSSHGDTVFWWNMVSLKLSSTELVA